MSYGVFTDNQLAQLFLELQNDFKSQRCQEERNIKEITSDLGKKLDESLQTGNLKDLPNSEKHKAYQVFVTVTQSMPEHLELPKEEQEIRIPKTIVKEIHHYHNERHYCNQSNSLLDWYILSTIFKPSYTYNYNVINPLDGHHHGRNEERKEADPLAQLLVVIIIGSLALSALVLTFYTLRELVDCGDRFFHNEGMLRALVSMATMTASGIVGTFLGSVVLAGPLASLAIAAGTSPAGVIFLAAVALTFIGSGIAALLINEFRVQEYFIRKNNKDVIDPAEPQRFSLTQAQEDQLLRKGLDIIKVKCAMVAIRNQIGGSHIQDKLWRMFTNKGQAQQELLEQLRDLKEGKCCDSTIKIGDMTFDLHAPAPESGYYYQEENLNQPFVFQPQPSAPPLEPELMNKLYPDLFA